MSYTPTSSLGTRTLLASAVANQASVDMSVVSGFTSYVIELRDIVPVVDNSELWLRFSTDNGTTFLAGATAYSSEHHSRFVNHVAQSNLISISDAEIPFTSAVVGMGMGINAGEKLNATVTLYNPDQNLTAVKGWATVSLQTALDTPASLRINFSYNSVLASNVNAVRFLPSTGNFSAGTAKLYGIV